MSDLMTRVIRNFFTQREGPILVPFSSKYGIASRISKISHA